MRSVLFAFGLLLALPVAAKEKPQVPAVLAPTHGYVYLAFPKGGGDAITVAPVAGGRDLKVNTPATAVSLPAAQAFGQWLPAGRYRIKQWGVWQWPDGPQFEVQAGRVTDLGDVMPVNVGGYQFVVVPVTHPEHAGSLAEAIKPMASVLKESTPIPATMTAVSLPITIGQKPSGMGLIWDLLVAHDRKVNKPSTLDALIAAKDPNEFLRLLRGVTPPLQDEPGRLSDGTLFFPADLGQLRKRTPDGQWSSLGMDTLRQILAVEYADGRLIAGSDDGHLRDSRDGGATWTDLKALGRLESILDIDHTRDAWVVTTTERFDDPDAERGSGFVVAARGTLSVRLRVYVGHREDLSDLALSKEFTLAPKDQAGWLGARGQLVGSHYYVMAGTALQRLDLASGDWKTITPGPRISSHRVDPTTEVVTALWSQGAFSKVYISSDHGDTWTQIGRPPYIISDVQMDSTDRGWASRWNMNAFGGVWETYAFVPAKNDWDKSGEAPFNCRLMRIAPDLPVLCLAPDASILGLHDGKWDAEFSAQ
ncbi:hypothetical protein GCM10027431_10840 [Lysobacter rhizosphaerae]